MEVLFKERLLPSFWVWLIAVACVGMVAVAYGAALGSAAGLFVFAGGTILAIGLLLVTSPTIEVTSTEFVAGRARLPIEWVGKVAQLDREESVAARTTKAHPNAYLILRTVAGPECVIAEVTDPRDPHPYWLVSSRRPRELVQALLRARPVVPQVSKSA